MAELYLQLSEQRNCVSNGRMGCKLQYFFDTAASPTTTQTAVGLAAHPYIYHWSSLCAQNLHFIIKTNVLTSNKDAAARHPRRVKVMHIDKA
jgi:hypothetical protein